MKLLADSMLGSLGRWLRLMGYDTAIAQREPDAQLVRRALAEGRVILTRDRALALSRYTGFVKGHANLAEKSICLRLTR